MVGIFIFIYLVIGFRHAQRKVNNPNPALRPLWASDMSLSQQQRLLRFWAIILLFPLSINADRRSNTTQETFTPLIILIVSYMIFEVFSYRTGAVCDDGSDSDATGSGACSWHGGVDDWKESSNYGAFFFVIGLIIIAFGLYLYVKNNREEVVTKLKPLAIKILYAFASIVVLCSVIFYVRPATTYETPELTYKQYQPATYKTPESIYQRPPATYVAPEATYVPPAPVYVPPESTYQRPPANYVTPEATYVPPASVNLSDERLAFSPYKPPAPVYVPPTPMYQPEIPTQELLAKQAAQQLLIDATPSDAEAQYRLGMQYYDGAGVEQNRPEAARLLLLSAQQGNVDAQSNIGVLYYLGDGVTQNNKQALYWIRKAVEADNMNAQNNLGVLFYDGRALKKDDFKAQFWFDKAAAQGDGHAVESLSLFKN